MVQILLHSEVSKIYNWRSPMDLSIGTLLFFILSCCLWDSEARYYQHIWVENGVKKGYYSIMSMCPKGYAFGFSLKIQEYQGSLLWQDDTSLNGIRLYCSDGSVIESSVGQLGVWSRQQYCYNNHLNAFRLRVDPLHGWGMAYDDTAANNIQFMCENGERLEGYGFDWGTYGSWSKCHFGSICGLQTRVESGDGVPDKTALNDVIFLCCH